MNENKKVLLPPGVYSHCCYLLPQISSPPSAFYALLEAALEETKIPKVAISRVYHKEGGLLSAQREYLRMNFRVAGLRRVRSAVWHWLLRLLCGLRNCHSSTRSPFCSASSALSSS